MIFEVNRQDFRQTRTVDVPAATLTAGRARLAVERFAFTSNGINDLLEGQADPAAGFICTMHQDPLT